MLALVTKPPPATPRLRIDDRGRVLSEAAALLSRLLPTARRFDFIGAPAVAVQALADAIALVAGIHGATVPSGRRLRYRGALSRLGVALAALERLHERDLPDEGGYRRPAGAITGLLQLLHRLCGEGGPEAGLRAPALNLQPIERAKETSP